MEKLWGVMSVVLAAVGCASPPPHSRVAGLDPGRIELRENALGMFYWAPPPPPPERLSPRWGRLQMVPEEQAIAAAMPKAAPIPKPTPIDLERLAADAARRDSIASDWSAHAGPGIAAVQTFGASSLGIVVYGEACSDGWLDANVEPIWPALRQHGFLAVHCQGPVNRVVWPRRIVTGRLLP